MEVHLGKRGKTGDLGQRDAPVFVVPVGNCREQDRAFGVLDFDRVAAATGPGPGPSQPAKNTKTRRPSPSYFTKKFLTLYDVRERTSPQQCVAGLHFDEMISLAEMFCSIEAVSKKGGNCPGGGQIMAQLIVSWFIDQGRFRVHAVNAIGRRRGRIIEVEEVDTGERFHGSTRRLERLVQTLRRPSGELDDASPWKRDA